MAKLDSNIYGADETAFASRVASDALSTGGEKEDIWGARIEQDARSKGNDPENENPDAKAVKFVGTETAKKSEGN